MSPRWLIGVMAAALLAAPAEALAGGWATVSLSSTPDGLAPGQAWVAELRVLQHGRTPLDGLEPTVTVIHRATGTARTTPARPAGRAGTYRIRAVFPTAGEWEYVIDDGFSRRHSYPVVHVGAKEPGAAAAIRPAGDSPAWRALFAALLAGVAAASGVAILQRPRARGRAGTEG